MRTLFVGSLLATLIYLLILPFHQYRLLSKATKAAGQGTFDIAELYTDRLRNESPNFFYTQSKLLCGQISIQRARTLAHGPNPSFGEATRLLAGMTTRCDATIYYEVEAQQVVESIAALHLTAATDTCHRGNHDGALRDFQIISTLPYPERVLLEARKEATWCRVDYARELRDKGWYDDAMKELIQASSSQDGGIRLATLNLGRSIVEREMNSLLDQEQYVTAFKTFSSRRKELIDHQEAVSFFYVLQQQLDFRIFGLALGSICRDNSTKPKGHDSGPPSTEKFPAIDAALSTSLGACPSNHRFFSRQS